MYTATRQSSKSRFFTGSWFQISQAAQAAQAAAQAEASLAAQVSQAAQAVEATNVQSLQQAQALASVPIRFCFLIIWEMTGDDLLGL